MSEPKPLSKRERNWIKRIQKALDACPTKRLGFYTIGDAQLTVYDRRFDQEIDGLMDAGRGDFGPCVDECDAWLEEIRFPAPVHSTAG